MVSASREPYASLIDALRSSPERFDLIQAVRLLERAALRAGGAAGPIGFDSDPRNETVRLRASLDLAFPANEVSGFDDSVAPPELSLAAMGLFGVSGALPAHYSQLVLEAARQKNTALRDFLDVFNHRALSLFVRAARKYRLPLEYEHAYPDRSDAISDALLALIGMGEPSLRARQPIPDEVLVFYAGHFAHRPRTAAALGQLLSDHFDRAVTVLQFQGCWITLPEPERTRLGGARRDPACFAVLGADAVLGSSGWDVQGSFRLRLGPLDHSQFLAFLPGSARMAELAAITRTYVGSALRFDVQLILRAAEVPPLVLHADQGTGPRLGWNTWLRTEPGQNDASDAVFEVESPLPERRDG